MSKSEKSAAKPRPESASPEPPSPETIEKTEQDPAVERGERIDVAKDIARSGKSHGSVPGATPKQ